MENIKQSNTNTINKQQQSKEVHLINETRNNQSQMKIKIGVIQLLHSNPFTGLDHKDRMSHMIKFYKNA